MFVMLFVFQEHHAATYRTLTTVIRARQLLRHRLVANSPPFAFYSQISLTLMRGRTRSSAVRKSHLESKPPIDRVRRSSMLTSNPPYRPFDHRHDQQPRREVAPDMAHDRRPSVPLHRGHRKHYSNHHHTAISNRSVPHSSRSTRSFPLVQVVEWDQIS